MVQRSGSITSGGPRFGRHDHPSSRRCTTRLPHRLLPRRSSNLLRSDRISARQGLRTRSRCFHLWNDSVCVASDLARDPIRRCRTLCQWVRYKRLDAWIPLPSDCRWTEHGGWTAAYGRHTRARERRRHRSHHRSHELSIVHALATVTGRIPRLGRVL